MNNTINDLMYSAELFRHSVDVPKECYIKRIAEGSYKDFLTHRIANPTRADIAMHNMHKRFPVMFPMAYESNMHTLEKVPEIDTLIKTGNENYKKLYPKTGGLRKRLIGADRLAFDEVKPALKGIKKQLLRLGVLF